LPGYKPLDYGTPHPDQTRFKGAKLVYQEPIDNSDSFVRRIYATDRVDQDAYNYGIKLSAGSPDHPIYVRSYVLPRADYQPLPDGAPDPNFPDAYLVEEEMAPVEGELNSLYVRVTRAYETLPGPVLTSFETNEAGQKVTVTTQRKSSSGYNLPAASATSSPSATAEDTGVVTEQIRSVPAIFTRQQFSAERPDPLPTKFRARVPDVETSSIVAGAAQQPTLDVPQDLSASETQETQFLKRVSRRLRPDPVYPVTFIETTRTNAGQIATVTSVLEDFIQSADSGPFVESSEVTDLGDGRSIKVTTEVDQVFEQPSFTRAKEDITPVKFRAAVSETVEERTVPGTAVMPVSLGPNELSKTEEQLTLDRKRVRTQERNITTAEPLVEQVVTPEGQLATRTLTLSDQPQEVTPSATLLQGEVEQLGDGRSVKTEVKVAQVFDEKQQSKQKPDVVPAEFRASLPDITSVEVKTGDQAVVGVLGADEVSKTVQRVTENKIRESTTVRQQGPLDALKEQLVDNDLVKVNRTRTVVKGAQQITPTATVSGQVQALGDGYTLKIEDTKTKVFAGSAFSQEKPDNVPVEFRAERPAVTEEFSEAGVAVALQASLTGNEIAKSVQQVNEFVRRTRKTTRDLTSAAELIGEQIDEDGVKVAVKRTLASGPQTITPSATVRGQVESIGDKKTIKTELTRAGIFDGQAFTVEKTDNIPVAFRAEKPVVTDEITLGGEAKKPSLEGDEIAKSEQQITKFLKRVRTTTRANVDTVELKDQQINQFGQKVDITRTLRKASQTITPSAKISGSVESLGDKYTLKTEETLGTVFTAKTFSVERPDSAPEKFRVERPIKTTQEIVEGKVVEPQLGDNDLSKSEQQQTEFTKRTTTTKRDTGTTATLKGKQTGIWGIEDITETYDENGDITVGYKTLSNKKVPLGGKKFLGEKIEVVSPATLTEYKQDPDTGIFLKVQKSLIASSATKPALVTNGSVELQAIDAWNTIQIITTVDTLPNDEIFESTLNYKYPDELEEVGINWENGKDGGETNDDIENRQYIIDNAISWSFAISAYASSSLRGSAYLKIKNGYSGPVRCKVTRKYSRTPPKNAPTIKDWKPVYGSLTINSVGKSLRSSRDISGVGDTRLKQGDSRQIKTDTSANTIVFGPVVHSGITLTNPEPTDTTVNENSDLFVGPISESSQLPDGGGYPAIIISVTPSGKAELKLPSSATPPKSGDKNIGLVNVEKWRFGVWIEEVYEVFHP
jgi:hypothetical protein